MRIRVLEASIANEYFSGVDDLTMPRSQFCALSLPVQRCLWWRIKSTS